MKPTECSSPQDGEVSVVFLNKDYGFLAQHCVKSEIIGQAEYEKLFEFTKNVGINDWEYFVVIAENNSDYPFMSESVYTGGSSSNKAPLIVFDKTTLVKIDELGGSSMCESCEDRALCSACSD